MNLAIVTFGEVSGQLYEQKGLLKISNKLTGEPIDIEIPREKSEGVEMMQIFCFDMTAVQICQERDLSPGFVVHDSHLYDSVDARQVGEAIRLAGHLAERKGFQYFTMLNSDKLDQLVAETGTDFSDAILPVSLSDEPTGGLFGRPFGRGILSL